MKIKLLREYIQNILLEGGAPDSSGVAAIEDNSSENTVVILFRYDILYKELNKSKKKEENLSTFLTNSLQQCVVGFGSFGAPEEGSAFGAWQVYNASGEGYGKILYGMGYALSPHGLLMPDRFSVSTKAASAWKKSSKERKSHKLDNLPPNNKTKSTHDDAMLLNKPDSEYLDYAYEEIGWEKPMTKKILRLGDAAIEEIISFSNGKLDYESIKSIMIEIGKESFKNAYSKSTEY